MTLCLPPPPRAFPHPQNLYERVCEQREKRLDEDDLITEFQKTIEVVKKEKETAAKKQKVVEQGLAAIQQEITEFQREKQVRGGLWGEEK